MDQRPKTIFLFDVDGTLTQSRLQITPSVKEMLFELRKRVYIGFVGGSDLSKQIEQVGPDILDIFDYGFPENGVICYTGNTLTASNSLISTIGEEKYRIFVDYVLKYLSEMNIPVKRGTFIELRTSMVNICPVGRNCSQKERIDFFEYDKVNKIRETMVEELRKRFDEFGLHFSIGGQISIDVFPKGWDKTYCLRHLEDFKEIYFFGDKVDKGGNDYEIYEDRRTVGTRVNGPEEINEKVNARLKEIGMERIE